MKRVLLFTAVAALIAAVPTSTGAAASAQKRFAVKTAAFDAVGGSGVTGRALVVGSTDRTVAVLAARGLKPLATYIAIAHSDASCSAGETLLAKFLSFPGGLGFAVAFVRVDVDTINSIGLHAADGTMVACANLQDVTTLRLSRTAVQKLERRLGLPAVAPRR